MARIIFITGGVVSSLGKGLAGASLAALLQIRGYKVRIRKLDPYLNIDPGTMSPYQHGEVFVTEDGGETDLDLGHYERFTSVNTRAEDSISMGKIYSKVLAAERRGDYLGATIQVIPHITNSIKETITQNTEKEDFLICEIGGTVGDIEGMPCLEAMRQLLYELGPEKAMSIHATLVPYIKAAGELKTKPTQHSVKELQRYGIQPHMLLCRADTVMDEGQLNKIGLFCNLPVERVIPAYDVSDIHEAPIAYHKVGLDVQVCKFFGLPHKDKLDLSEWQTIVDYIHEPQHSVNIALVGKYNELADAYKSVVEALRHAGIHNRARVNIVWTDSEQIEKASEEELEDMFSNIDGILTPGGFGSRGTEGKIRAAQYSREHKVPYFGICLGLQVAIIEFCRNVLGIKDANSKEITDSCTPIVGLMEEWVREGKIEQREAKGDMGGTMRLGAYPAKLTTKTLAHTIYGSTKINERHRHRYELDMDYADQLAKNGMIISGQSPDGQLPEIGELSQDLHPFFIGVQFHPEFKSRPFTPHPVFAAFIEASLKQRKNLHLHAA